MVKAAKKQAKKDAEMKEYHNWLSQTAKESKGGSKDTDRERYHDWLFQISNSLLHEIAHVFVTYLSKGEQNTPTYQRLWKPNPTPGEAGHALEVMIFGGPLEYRADPDTVTRVEDVCLPALPLFHGLCIGSELIRKPGRCGFCDQRRREV